MPFPFLAPVQDADNQHTPAFQQIDDQVRPMRVQANRRIEFSALAGQAWIIGDQVERRGQPCMILLCLGQSEFTASMKKDVDDVLIGFPCRPIRHGPTLNR